MLEVRYVPSEVAHSTLLDPRSLTRDGKEVKKGQTDTETGAEKLQSGELGPV